MTRWKRLNSGVFAASATQLIAGATDGAARRRFLKFLKTKKWRQDAHLHKPDDFQLRDGSAGRQKDRRTFQCVP